MLFLLEDKKKNSVLKQFKRLDEKLGTETFRNTFPVMLTDNGVEFADPIALETGNDGEQRTKIFYCDPGKSCQKGNIEKNHKYIRYVIPKGNTFDLLDEESVVNLMNHINSTSGPGLNGRTPTELAKLLFEGKVKEKLKLMTILGDDVIQGNKKIF